MDHGEVRVSSFGPRCAKKTENGMLRKASTALAAMLVLGSLATARAEDPDTDVTERSHAFVDQAPSAPSHHARRGLHTDRRIVEPHRFRQHR